MKQKLCLLFLSFFSVTFVFAQKTLTVKTDSVYDADLTEFISVTEEQKNFDNLENVYGADFKPLKTFKFTNQKSAFWFKIRIFNTSALRNFTFVIGKNIDFVDMHTSAGQSVQSGWLLPMQKKSIPTSYFEAVMLDLPQFQETDIYFRIKNKSELPFVFLWHLEEYETWTKKFTHKKLNDNILHFFLQGMFWIILIYNAFLFFVSGDRVYIFYAGYIAGASFFVMQNVGMITEFIATEKPEMSYYIRLAGVFGGGVSYVLFARVFLETKKLFPKWDKALIFTALLFVALGILLFAAVAFFYKIQLYITLASAYAGLVYLGLIAFSLFLIFNKNANRISFYFSLGMMLFSASALVGILVRLREPSVNLAFFIEVGLVLEILVFSLGLGYRMKMTEMKKMQAEAEVAAMLKEQNEILEKKVHERTLEIQQQKEEIMVQNEELFQQKEEILAQRDYIEKQNYELEVRNKQTEDSIRAALALQSGILPSEEKMRRWFGDYFMLFLPKDIVSGDFFWGAEVGEKTFFAVGDCTGHGVSGALATMIGYAKIDKIVRSNSTENPAVLLELLDAELSDISKNAEVSTSFGMDIALLVIEKNENGYTVNFASAKRPLFYFDANNQIIHEIKATRKSLGIGRKEENPNFHSLRLLSGDSLYLFTDGYPDQNNAAREKFGMISFKKILDVLGNLDMNAQKELLLKTLKNYKEGTSQRDDILVFGGKLS